MGGLERGVVHPTTAKRTAGTTMLRKGTLSRYNDLCDFTTFPWILLGGLCFWLLELLKD